MHHADWLPRNGFEFLKHSISSPHPSDLRSLPTLQLDDKIDSLQETVEVYDTYFSPDQLKWWNEALKELQDRNGSRCTTCKQFREIMFANKASKHHSADEKKARASASKDAYAKLNAHLLEDADDHKIDAKWCWPLVTQEVSNAVLEAKENGHHNVSDSKENSETDMTILNEEVNAPEENIIPDPRTELFAVGRQRRKPIDDLEVGDFVAIVGITDKTVKEKDSTTKGTDGVWFGRVKDIDTKLSDEEVQVVWYWNNEADINKRLDPGYLTTNKQKQKIVRYTNRKGGLRNPYMSRIPSQSLILWGKEEVIFRHRNKKCTFLLKPSFIKKINDRQQLK
jgi:hypothetical protein